MKHLRINGNNYCDMDGRVKPMWLKKLNKLRIS